MDTLRILTRSFVTQFAPSTHDALVNGNFAAAERLVERGAPLTLATALSLGRWGDVQRLAQTATARDKQIGLVLAALNGKAEALNTLIGLGVDLNGCSTEIYSTRLHFITPFARARWTG